MMILTKIMILIIMMVMMILKKMMILIIMMMMMMIHTVLLAGAICTCTLSMKKNMEWESFWELENRIQYWLPCLWLQMACNLLQHLYCPMSSKHLKGCSGPASLTLFGEFPFLDTFGSRIRENVSRNRRNDKKCLEMGENENPFSPISRHFWV